MARVTVEDCLRNVKNRFELVMVASKRARQIMRGNDPKVDWDNDKPTVVALREIAAGLTNAQNVNVVEKHEEFFHTHSSHDDSATKHEAATHPSTHSEDE